MDIPLELSFRNMRSSDALKAAVREHVDELEQFHDHIVGCRVVIEMPRRSQSQRQPARCAYRGLRVPGKEVVVGRELAHNGHKKAATDAYAVLDNAFAVAQSSSRTIAASAMAM